jgi:hypothetical protein
MQIQDGDLVQTVSGLSGRVIHVSKLTAFVELELEGGKEVVPLLLSELIRVDQPQLPSGPTMRQTIPGRLQDGGQTSSPSAH